MPRRISHIAVGVIYHPPDAVSGVMTNHITGNIDSILQQHPYAGVVIMGDFNRLNDKPLCDFPLKQIVKRPTRGKVTLDKIYTNVADWFLQPTVIPNIASSDHCAVLLTPITRSTTDGGRVRVAVRSNSKNGKNLLAHALVNFDWQMLEDIDNIDMKVEYFSNCINTLIDMFLPVRMVARHVNDKPWVTDEFRRLIRCRQYAWTTGNYTKYNRLRNQVNRLSKQLRRQYYTKSIEGLKSTNPHTWWQEIKKLTGQITRPELQVLANSMAGGDVQLLADMINASLQQVSKDLTPLSPILSAEFDDSVQKYVIEPWTVFDKLSRINVHKSPGPDGIPNWFLRDFAFAVAEPVCHIFNCSVQRGEVPTLWKMANVVPIPKVRPPKSIDDDLRPISLTATLSKILESLVGQWMLPTIAEKFDARQFGALKRRSTTHALIDIIHMWQQALDDRRSIRTLFIDYRKAFDHVDHTTVLNKMSALNIHPFIRKWMHSFLSNRQQRVKIGSVVSEWISPNGGMPQGTWFGPYIFLILINDLETFLTLFKFVDDITMSEIIDHTDTTNGSRAQAAADQIAEWSHRNYMNVNVKKTKEMLLGPVKKDPPPLIEFGSITVERVCSFKLLGVNIMDNLSWDDHVSAICSKAGKRLHLLKLLRRSSVTASDQLQFYKSVIRPVIDYACPVWQSGLTADQRERLESVQRRALRIISGSTDYELQCAVLDVDPVIVRLDSLTRSFFERICRPNDCLYRLIPVPRPTEIIGRLRHTDVLPPPTCRTDRFKQSFLPHALAKYQ